jgi:hypothetical protein
MTSAAVQLVETWQDVPRALPPGVKGRQTARDPARVRVVLIHQTAVSGGFDVSRAQLAKVPADLPEPERERLARQTRYTDTPYHGLFDVQARASIVQWPAWAFMWHGNGGNPDSVGWAYDGKFPGDDLDIDGGREALEHMIDCARRQGAKLEQVAAHRQHNANRGGDPGAEIWRGIVLPVAAKCRLSEATRITGSGRTIPANWY